MSLWDKIELLYGDITMEEAIEKLRKEIVALTSWLKDFDDDPRSTVFYEKTRLLNEKIEELSEFTTIKK